MQYEMSGASLPGIVPKPALAPPGTEPAVKRPKSRGGWWALLFILLAAGGAYWLRISSNDSSSGKSGPVVTRTAAVTRTRLDKTIRITGVTGAENFVSLVTPQLRGSRGGGGRDTGSKTYASGGNPILVIKSNQKNGAGVSSTASAGGSVASSAGAGSNQSTALQSSPRASASQAALPLPALLPLPPPVPPRGMHLDRRPTLLGAERVDREEEVEVVAAVEVAANSAWFCLRP